MASTRMSLRAAAKRSKESVSESQPYAVVCFDDSIGVVPWHHVTMVDSADETEKCRVLWSDGSSYDAFVIFKGTKADCLLREKEELEKEEENESGSEMNKPPSQIEEKPLPSMPLKKKRKRLLVQKLERVGQEMNKSLEKENEPPEDRPSMPVKKPKRIVKQKLQKTDNLKNEATDTKQARNKKLPDFIIHVSSSPPLSPTSKLPFQNITNATGNEMVKNNDDDEVEDCIGVSCGSIDIVDDDISSTSDDEDEDVPMKTVTVSVSNDTTPRKKQIHSLNNVQDDMCDDRLEDIWSKLSSLKNEQECRFDEVCVRLDRIENQMKLFFFSGVANALLSPTVQHFSNFAQ